MIALSRATAQAVSSAVGELVINVINVVTDPEPNTDTKVLFWVKLIPSTELVATGVGMAT